MKLSFEETLIDVWRQALVENAKAIELGTERFPVRWLPSAAFRRWTSYSMVMRFVALSKTRKRNLDRPRWRGRAGR